MQKIDALSRMGPHVCSTDVRIVRAEPRKGWQPKRHQPKFCLSSFFTPQQRSPLLCLASLFGSLHFRKLLLKLPLSVCLRTLEEKYPDKSSDHQII